MIQNSSQVLKVNISYSKHRIQTTQAPTGLSVPRNITIIPQTEMCATVEFQVALLTYLFRNKEQQHTSIFSYTKILSNNYLFMCAAHTLLFEFPS